MKIKLDKLTFQTSNLPSINTERNIAPKYFHLHLLSSHISFKDFNILCFVFPSTWHGFLMFVMLLALMNFLFLLLGYKSGLITFNSFLLKYVTGEKVEIFPQIKC